MPKPKKECPASLFTGDDKDILIAYCQGLPVSKCKKAYMLLREEFSPDKSRYIRFNELAQRDDSGLVRLKKAQLTRLGKTNSEFAIQWKIGRLHKYIDYLKSHSTESSDMRAKWRRYRDGDHYQVLARGWVHEAFLKENPQPVKPAGWIDFYKISTAEEAIAYIEQEGLEQLTDSPELEFLTNRYHSVASYIIERLKEVDDGIGYQNPRVE